MKCASVLPSLFVGPDPRSEEEFQQLKALNITAILSLQTDEDRRDGSIESERAAATEAGLGFCSVPVEDFSHADLQLRLADCVAALERMLRQGKTVYVHCTAGVSRSPTVAAAYLHWCLGWELERALDHLQACRDCYPDVDAIRGARWPGDAPSR
ncbi:MAG: dual specificity protein phosphatase family protein [Acidobacteriia bacterium]|nr:dual specificity protein phosphatase family protein [Terriglobia bacterium]